MPRINANQISIYHEDTRGVDEPLVLLHAYLGRCDVWAGQRIHLAADFRVITYDARGHGRTEAPEDASSYTPESAVADCLGLLDALGIESAHLAGLSMGAGTVLQLLLEHPERVRSAILSDCGGGSDDPDRLRHWAARLAEAFRSHGSEWTYEHHLERSELVAGLGSQRKTALEGMRKLVLSQNPRAMAHTVEGILAARPPVFELEAELRRVSRPVLVLYGEKDEPVLRASRFLAHTIPDAEAVAIPGVSHVTNIQAPAAWNRATREFLARSSA
jgi:pimeloyl-ACP methyl ester carboxylesterase